MIWDFLVIALPSAAIQSLHTTTTRSFFIGKMCFFFWLSFTVPVESWVYSLMFAEPVTSSVALIPTVWVVVIHLTPAGLGLHEMKKQSGFVLFLCGLVLGLVT